MYHNCQYYTLDGGAFIDAYASANGRTPMDEEYRALQVRAGYPAFLLRRAVERGDVLPVEVVEALARACSTDIDNIANPYEE